jgi:hypothetical protein
MLDNAFEQQRKLIELLEVRVKLAIENDERVDYGKCHPGQQQRSVVRISPLSNTGNRQQPNITTAR